jgi:hypothetical protein
MSTDFVRVIMRIESDMDACNKSKASAFKKILSFSETDLARALEETHKPTMYVIGRSSSSDSLRSDQTHIVHIDE